MMETNLIEAMGISLCKERDNRNRNSISPVDRVIGHCVQICPQSLGKKKHFWDKQVLETSPPLNQQPKSNHSEWQTATLSVPDSPTDSMHPVAPPRKKKSSKLQESIKKSSIEILPDQNCNNTLSAPEMSSVKDNLKKESMANNGEDEQASTSTNGSTIPLNVLENKKELEEDNLEFTSSKPLPLTRKISKVGNKKSDKFFGENLSDCLSNEPLSNLEREEGEKEVAISSEIPQNIKDLHAENKKIIGATLDTKFEDTKTENQEGLDKNISEIEEVENKEIVNLESKKGEDEVDNVKIQGKDLVEENDEIVVNIVEDSEEMIRKINKEKGDMIFAIEKEINKNNHVEYGDKKPVEEEIIVPVKRVPRHICDDETHLRQVLPKYEPVAPKKPQRDFSKYKKTLESMKSDAVSHLENSEENMDISIISVTQQDVNEKTSLKGHLEEDITSETETIPADDIGKDETNQNTNREIIDEKKLTSLKRRSDSIPSNMMNSEKILRRCLSTQSYLTADLIEKIAAQANNLSMSQGYLPEDYACLSNDGSSLVSPSSKLHERKRSNSQISTNEPLKSESNTDIKENLIQENKRKQQRIIDEISNKNRSNEENSNASDDMSVQQKILISEESVEKVSDKPNQQQGTADDENIDGKPEKVTRTPKRKISANAFEKTQREISEAIQSFLGKEDLTPKNILKLLEEEFGELLNSQKLPPEDKELIEQLRKSVSTCQLNPSTPVQEKYVELDVKEQQTEITKEVKDETNKLRKEVNETLQIETEIPSNLSKVQNKVLDALTTGDKRRHSIDDLDSWFSSNSVKDDDNREIKRKREISLPDCLDPPTLNKQNLENNEPTQKHETTKVFKSTNDHSSLLRFLENEKINYYD